jgi:large subunit ribosomal protein L10
MAALPVSARPLFRWPLIADRHRRAAGNSIGAGAAIPEERRETLLAITRKRKEDLISQYVDLLERTNGFVIIQYRGLTVTDVDALRAKIREAQGQYVVTKNTLFTRALQETGWPVPDDLLNGPIAVAFGLEDFPSVAKAVLDFSGDRDAEKVGVKGGVMMDTIFDAKKVEAISKLPSLDELRSQLAGLIVQPATGLVSVLNAATGQVVNVINAYVQENQSEEGAA